MLNGYLIEVRKISGDFLIVKIDFDWWKWCQAADFGDGTGWICVDNFEAVAISEIIFVNEPKIEHFLEKFELINRCHTDSLSRP